MKAKLQVRVSPDRDYVNYHLRKNGKEVEETALTEEEKQELGDAMAVLAWMFGSPKLMNWMEAFLKEHSERSINGLMEGVNELDENESEKPTLINMQTENTTKNHDGDPDLTMKDFLLQCAEAIDPCISNPEKIKPSDFYLEQIAKVEEELKDFEDNPKSYEEWEEEYQKAYDKAFESYQEYFERSRKETARNQKLYEEVANWVPPTKYHKNLKELALGQLKRGMSWEQWPFKFPEKEEWIARERSGSALLKKLANYRECYARELAVCEDRIRWINELKDSLGA